MEFYPNTPFDKFAGQHVLWEAIKDAFKPDEGAAFYRYPIKAMHNDVNYEPDTLVALREHGVIALECKGIRLEQLTEVQGHVWYTRGFYSDEITPVAQAEDQAYAVQGRVFQIAALRNAVRFHARAVLPFITRAAWEGAGLPEQSMVLFQDDLKPAALRAAVAAMNARHAQPALSDAQWGALRGVFGAKVVSVANVSVPRDAPANHPRRVIKSAFDRIAQFDQAQLSAALVTPPGPQRLRGLAGSGKTVILAKRIAALHARHPEWDLAFVFHTKSLYDQVQHRILREYQDLLGTTAQPNWTRLRVWHAWGGTHQQGFYHHLCQVTGQPTERFKQGEVDFTGACDRLEARLSAQHMALPELFDAVFIDEGQDLPHSFYRLALASLRDPKRLTWAFDEAQSINRLSAPEAAVVFGRDASGLPNVDLSRRYEGGAQKSLTMRRSYRTPNRVLMAAHAVNMGLFREGGAVQGMTNREGWEAIGYEVLEGDFTREGQPMRVQRPTGSHAHPFDADPALLEAALSVAPVIDLYAFTGSERERTFLAASLKSDLERGFKPEDLLVVALDDGFASKRFLVALQTDLAQAGIRAHVVNDTWQVEGSVALSHIYRAKGNEAARVYACRFEFAHQAVGGQSDRKTEVQARNGALVAMTRARFWLTVSSGGPAPVLEEVRRAAAQYPLLAFESFTQRTLQRVLEIADDEPDGQLPLRF